MAPWRRTLRQPRAVGRRLGKLFTSPTARIKRAQGTAFGQLKGLGGRIFRKGFSGSGTRVAQLSRRAGVLNDMRYTTRGQKAQAVLRGLEHPQMLKAGGVALAGLGAIGAYRHFRKRH